MKHKRIEPKEKRTEREGKKGKGRSKGKDRSKGKRFKMHDSKNRV